ncbi:MAG: CAP domain-containing protein [Proteobacteria bacterium]|nr:CAP domain-containing protein [Pseudomonadota bacterium]
MEPETVKLSREEQKLVKLVMEHRASYGLPAIPISKSLTFVAKTHLLDLEKNKPVSRSCNGHSWSDKGSWSSCCYTGDHAQAKCMWDKPKELTNYPDSGFEIAFGADGNTMTQFSATAEVALAGWKSSRLHHNVILNRSMWRDVKWQAMGLAIYKTSACIWFGMKPDPAGSL